ncbi:type II toxin-antitoxin system prevent-host-death family antitoxin [Streptomyces boncukensis]|uniref:Type II toxin-antitoxin system prevent-host-death family antitoxin n=1 Tax=Streptomyces boncukensis TaxID=2711219 RepID=A0A6G4X2K6_9ACTN|nr:type II toxin-antitoxin system prevent-host-death family antitoxin [Streptomyces boncukensis]NGO71618.1 type II toxin-antitoxin system prevent-host-death family antitoxin [Streptomyces boncukensis]
MNDNPVELSVADARRQFADVLNSASARGRITYIISRGRRVAAVVPLPVAEDAERRLGAAHLDGEDGLTPP